MDALLGCLIGWIRDWGPGLLIALVMLYGLYRLILYLIKKIYCLGKEVGVNIVTAVEKSAGALNLQAQSMDKLTNSIQGYVGRDETEHREIILLLKVISNKVNRIEEAKNGP
jgi:hypothetical protein